MPPTAPAPSSGEQLPVRTAAVWVALDAVVGAGTPLRVLDVGGGSGVFAVPLARLGHEVTVVDPSADALATLQRRAQTAGVGDRVRGLQGDGDLLHELPLGSGVPGTDDGGGYDLALCHSVLEVVDDPSTTLGEITRALRPGGQVSVATVNRAGAVLARALGGHPKEALALLEDRDPAPGRTRPARRRFGPDDLLALVTAAGLRPGEWRGVAVVSDLLDAASGADPEAVRRLELALAGTSPYRDVATGLHVLATRP
ncbi:2-polyprenyl-3-methyl-5-hydroxy-6-metoxy-1,4-benzoquinol methylase [Geodermatophilus bullaregiensis]|uniref:class I SAM-dependent methyltransferase n=1 Tax=Geodermatophilus bullaregiensis TaxID=1564160 RepID=UPI00195B80AF|nr:methyltransferase domain-containing protein [Geodermatophilus bullaregiensis]MBM7804805.1 2-polyprenyl-3-methyl-5-hydroxy-6-metoxy-1,4-benzoquinol methylase [Geodermatophilus bullaregiensis]